MRKAEDVIDKEQNVAAGFIAELFGQCQAGQSNTHTRTGRFVHLAVDQRNFGFLQIVGNDNAGFDHLVI